MGKSSKKKGAQRKDVFYHRAKESGYRARSAFKIIQLDRKYNLFQNARVCIDLCAAPGSWMQVASKYMPVSSVIIGVDRFPIAHIPNTIAIQGDITTERVRQDLKSNLKNWKADIVLHDGAPNVGRSWLHDAYQQNLLVLHSFKLACEFLNKGGSFVTKVFRSRDHLSLQYIFKKLFRRVEATKPIASRFESAEIFVVCRGFLAPDKVDPEFFDAKHVFQPFEEPSNKTGLHLRKPEMTKRKAIGYEEGVTMLFKKRNISTFIKSKKFLDILADTNEFEWDLPSARNSVHTTDEIVISCQDLKVIGKREIRNLLSWRKLVRREYLKAKRENKLEYTGDEVEEEDDDDEEDKDGDTSEVEKDKTEDKNTSDDDEKNEAEKELDELSEIQKQIMELKMAKEKQDKQKERAKEKVKRKQIEKMKLQLMVPGDAGPQEIQSTNLFTLKTLNNTTNIDKIANQSTDILMDPEPEEETTKLSNKNIAYYSKKGTRLDKTGTYYKNSDDSSSESETDNEAHDSDADEGLRMEKEEKKAKKKKKKRVSFADEQLDNDEFDEEEEEEAKDGDWKWNPLVTDLVGDDLQEIRERKAERWFSKSMFENMETEDMEDYELEAAIEKLKSAGGTFIGKKPEPDKVDPPVVDDGSKKSQDYVAKDAPDSDSDFNSDSDSDTDSDSGVDSGQEMTMMEKKEEEKDAPKKKRKGLDPVGLALATKMIRSKKAMRDIYNEGWNRYMFDDPDAPEWFLEDEKKFNTPRIDVDKEDLRMYKDRDKAVDSRTIKKVTEAKARKQRRRKKRLLKVKKKAENLVSNMDMTAREKSVEINKLYKKATVTKPKDKKYFVMKRGYKGKRPKGAKGTIVDRRMKKDKLAKQKLMKKRGPRINKRPQKKVRKD